MMESLATQNTAGMQQGWCVSWLGTREVGVSVASMANWTNSLMARFGFRHGGVEGHQPQRSTQDGWELHFQNLCHKEKKRRLIKASETTDRTGRKAQRTCT